MQLNLLDMKATAVCSGDASKSKECVTKLRHLVSSGVMSDDMCHEVLYGRAGCLYALLYVGSLVPEAARDTQKLVEQLVDLLLEAGHRQAQAEASPCPLSFTWHGKHYLGAAHGLAGILTVLLQVHATQLALHSVQFSLFYTLGTTRGS